MKQIFFLIFLVAQTFGASSITEKNAHPFEMGWEKEEIRFGFKAEEEDVTLVLEVPGSYWNTLPEEDKVLFRQVKEDRFLFGFSTGPVDPWEAAQGILDRRDNSCFGAPLEADGVTPNFIEEDEIQALVSDGRVLFYTGAGISIASGIPDMKALERRLGFYLDFDEAVKGWIATPELIGEQILDFRDTCHSASPALGHHALEQLAQKTRQQIFTENLDWMHERVGTAPLRVSKQVLSDEEQIEDIQAIICVGLSQDDKGFLRWVKENHPEITLIAINPSCPIYLGYDDLWYPGDAHDLLPRLAHY